MHADSYQYVYNSSFFWRQFLEHCWWKIKHWGSTRSCIWILYSLICASYIYVIYTNKIYSKKDRLVSFSFWLQKMVTLQGYWVNDLSPVQVLVSIPADNFVYVSYACTCIHTCTLNFFSNVNNSWTWVI